MLWEPLIPRLYICSLACPHHLKINWTQTCRWSVENINFFHLVDFIFQNTNHYNLWWIDWWLLSSNGLARRAGRRFSKYIWPLEVLWTSLKQFHSLMKSVSNIRNNRSIKHITTILTKLPNGIFIFCSITFGNSPK